MVVVFMEFISFPDICLEEYSYRDFMQAFLIDAIDEFEIFLQYQET